MAHMQTTSRTAGLQQGPRAAYGTKNSCASL